jgi:hypothetical protein
MPYHHYVPEFHLAAFTDDATADGYLWVHDMQEARHWRTLPRRAGGETGYNTINLPGMDANALEELIGRIEGHLAPVVKEVSERLVLPSDDKLDLLIHYVALLSVRNPAVRRAMNDSQAQALRFMAMYMVNDPDNWEAAQLQYRRDGVPLLGELGMEEVRDMLDSGNFEYAMSNEAHLRGIGNRVDYMASLLRERTWSLLVSAPGVHDFVCSDKPSVLVWSGETAEHLLELSSDEELMPPGYASEDSEISVPLSKRCALIGRYGGPSGVVYSDGHYAGEINRRTVGNANRFVYSPEEEFVFRNAAGILRPSAVLFR